MVTLEEIAAARVRAEERLQMLAIPSGMLAVNPKYERVGMVFNMAETSLLTVLILDNLEEQIRHRSDRFFKVKIGRRVKQQRRGRG